MDNTSNSQLQNANRNLEDAIESTTNLINAGTAMIWVVVAIIVLGFITGACKALFGSKRNNEVSNAPSNIRKDADTASHTNKQPTIGGKIAFGVLIAILLGIFLLVAYVIIQYA